MNNSLCLVECYSSDGYTNQPICPSFLTTKEQADRFVAKCGPIFAKKY